MKNAVLQSSSQKLGFLFQQNWNVFHSIQQPTYSSVWDETATIFNHLANPRFIKTKFPENVIWIDIY